MAAWYNTDSLGKPHGYQPPARAWAPAYGGQLKISRTDEVDSALISISVPNGLKDVSNGRLRKVTDLKDGYTRFDWFVSQPINNYDIEANIGDYTHYKAYTRAKKANLPWIFGR
jgi:hypothetical protein